MVFVAIPDAVPQVVYQASQIIAVNDVSSSAQAAVKQMTYGVCQLAYPTEREVDATRDNSVNTFNYTSQLMVTFLSKRIKDAFQDVDGGFVPQDISDWVANWESSFKYTVLHQPEHGKFVNMKNDPYGEYLPDLGYLGKDRIDLLVEAKDDLGRPIALTIIYYVNVILADEINAGVESEQTYEKILNKYCGTNTDRWRISSNWGQVYLRSTDPTRSPSP